MQLLPFLLLAACQENNVGVVVTPPVVAIENPTEDDELFEGVPVGMVGIVSDQSFDRELDKLTVLWLVNNERVCDDAVLDATGVTVCEQEFAQGTAEILLSVTNPDGGADDDTVTVEILPNGAPTVAIQTPTADGTYYSDHLVELLALVDDPEDPADALSVLWTATGPSEWSLETAPTSDGTAAGSVQMDGGEWYVTATVTDTAGRTAQDSVTMTVGNPNNSPECAITAPAPGSGVAEGQSATFEATASDLDVPADLLTAEWSSDLDGDLGASTVASDGNISFSAASLSTGAHTITLQVSDEVEATCTDTLQFLVGTQPNVLITAPASGDTANQGESVLYEATISDLDHDPADATLAWSSSVSGEFNTQSASSTGQVTFTSAALPQGAHTITLTATDPEGFTGSDSISFTVNGLPDPPEVAIDPNPATSADDLNVNIIAPAIDPEGDTITYTYAWYQDGLLTKYASAFVPSSGTTRGETWKVEVTPSDGSGEGDPGTDTVSIENSPPTVSLVQLTPDPAGVEDTLTCTPVGSADADGDSVSLAYSWTVNSVGISDTSNTLSGAFVSGDAVACVVTPADSTDVGTAVTSNTVTIGNTAPTIDSVTLTPTSAQVSDTLTCTPNGAADADGDSVSTAYSWEVGGVVISATTDTLASPDFASGDDVLCIVTPSDGTDSGTPVPSNTVTVDNTPPSLDTATLSPDPAYEADTVVCTPGTATDDDGDSVSYSYAWTVNGGSVSATSNSLTGTDFDKDDGVACVVTPNDGTDDGDPVTSDTLTISNSAPSVGSATITPTAPIVSDLLGVTLTGWSDDDGDTESYYYQWFVNGNPESGATLSTFSGAFVRDDVVEVVVTPWDGEDTGTPLTSGAVTIENAVPTLDSVSLTPTTATETTTLTCAANGENDDDGDGINQTIVWIVNSVTLSATGSTLDGGDFSKDDSVVCTITPDDGIDTGSTVTSNTVVVDNTPPELDSVSLGPDPAYEGDTLTCTAGTTSDADGDTVSVSHSWDVSGVTLSVTSTTLTSSYFDKGDAVSCTVTPDDGDDVGTSVISNTLTISNTAPSGTSVSISPSTALADDTLTASPAGWSDVDGDSEGWLYQWTVNTTDVTGATSSTLTGAFAKNDSVTVTAWPWDGSDAGSPVTSAALTIGNTPPTDPVVAISPSSPQPDDDLSCTLSTSSTDADGDTVYYTYTWEQNGVATSHATSLVAASDTSDGDTWTCCVSGSDGTDSSATVCDTASVNDTEAPNEPTLSSVDEYRNDDSMTLSGSCEAGCSLVFYLTDASGSWTESATCGSGDSFSHTVSLVRGDSTSAFATCEDSAGNVSGSSNTVTTEVCDPEDIWDSSTFSSGYGDSDTDPVDYWGTLNDDGLVTITIDGNLVATGDEDWYVIHTDDSAFGATSAVPQYDFQITMVEGTGTYTFIAYADSVGTSTQECTEYPDGYDEFSLTDTRPSCSSEPDYRCDDGDLGYSWYLELIRDPSVSPSCQGYTLEITNG